MKCSKCGAKALSELCFKCKPKKPLSSGKGLNRVVFINKKTKMLQISNKPLTKSPNNKHFDKKLSTRIDLQI